MAKPKSKDVKLEFPFEHDGREISVLTLRRMRAGDALIAEGEQRKERAGFLLFAALAGVEVEVIEKLDMDDFTKLTEVMSSMLGKSSKALVDKALKAVEQPSSGEI